MHKKILSMILAIAMVVSMFAGIAVTASAAETVTLSFTGGDASNQETWTFADEASGITAVFAANGYSTKPRCDAGLIRFYGSADKGGNTLTVSAPAGYAITGIEFTMNGSYTMDKVTVDSGELASNAWTGNAATVVFTATAQTRIVSAAISYEATGACTHENATGTPNTAASCTEPGEMAWSCPDCEATWTTVIEATGHTWTVVSTTEAKCEEDGAIVKNCTCGAEETEVIPATGHTYVDGFCACGAEEPAAAKFELITNASKLAEGDKLIIVGIKGEEYYAMSTESSSNNRRSIAVALNEDGTISEIDGLMVLTLGGAEDAWTLAIDDAYLNATSTTGSNHLKIVAAIDAYAYWNIAIDGATGVATIKNNGKDSRNWMRFNSSNNPPLFSCYSSGQADLYIYRVADENACAHEWSDWTVDVAASCETAGSQSRQCALCSEVETMEIPATGHTYIYTDNNTTVDGVCACTASVSYTVNTIAEAKAYTDNTVVYNVKGIVTYVSETEYYIQDETGAICVYFGYNVPMPEVALGDMLFVRDTMTTYSGLIETNYTTAADVVVLSAENELPLAEVTLAELLADTTNEFLGERVIVKDLTIGVINPADVTALTDAEGNTINLYKAEGLAENVSENDTVTVTAIVSARNGYQLRVNPGTAATDVVVTAEGEATVVTAITIAEAKATAAAEYVLIEGVVTFIDGRNVTIQDETGAINIYLKANAANTVVGDKVRVYGPIALYNGLIQLSGIDETNAEFYSVLSSDNTVDAQTVTVGELMADTTNEYLSEKVAINGLTIIAYASKNNVYTLTDGTGEITIFKGPKDAEGNALALGTKLNILEAIVSTYNGYQLRVADLSKLEITGTCAHETTEVKDAANADCTNDGFTGNTVCTICGAVVAEGQTIPAFGHSFVDGYCEECGEPAPVPVDYSGIYYIYAKRTAEGSTYFKMSTDLGTASTKRYQAVDTASTELPAEITDATEEYAFIIAANEDGTYTIATATGAYLGWTSGNSGAIVEAPLNVNIEAGEVEGTVRISFTGDALRVLALNGTAGNNYFAWYKASQIMDLALVPVTGELHIHNFINLDEEASQDPTCTEPGFNVFTCDCGASVTEEVEASGHNLVYVDNGETHSIQCCVCLVYTEENTAHTFVEGECVCGAIEKPAIEVLPALNVAPNISIGAEIQVMYTINAKTVSSYTKFYLEVSKTNAGGEPTVTTYGMDEGMLEFEVIKSGDTIRGYRATYTGIGAKNMGDEFTTTLYAISADGTIKCGVANTTSIKSYLTEKINAAASSAVLKTLAVDMLNYGAAAQLNFNYDVENLVNADLTEEQKALGTQTEAPATNIQSVSGTGANIITSVSVQNKVFMYLTVRYTAADASKVKFVIKSADGTVIAELPATAMGGGKAFQGSYDGVGAKQMREPITIEMQDDGVTVSQVLTWSVESYVAQTRASSTTSATLLNMVNALLIYGDSAAAYLA